MIDNHLKMQLEKATVALDKTAGIEGILIVAIDGRILHHNLRVDVDINLFGPMSQVISNSSHRLLNSSGQGDMERVLVESSGGKALFLGLENANLIVLMQDSANVGMVRVNAKRASEEINKATKDLELEIPEEVPIEEAPVEEVIIEETPAEEITIKETPTEEITVEDTSQDSLSTEEPSDKTLLTEEPTVEPIVEPVSELAEEPVKDLEVSESISEHEKIEEPVPPEKESEEVITEPETTISDELKEVEADIETAKVETETVKAEPETIESETETILKDSKAIKEEVKTEEAEVEETGPSIPTVKPPISFPSLPEHVEVPEDPEKRSELILDIYEKIFLAMSMGAAKIMGVAPARGLTKKFLPFEKCQRLLHNVNLKSNATIDFAQIKKNAEEIPISEREEIFIRDFSRMIEIITENYGRVMGYEAFRGMVRAEFLSIKKSYGDAMDELNIKKNMHPEIAHLFN